MLSGAVQRLSAVEWTSSLSRHFFRKASFSVKERSTSTLPAVEGIAVALSKAANATNHISLSPQLLKSPTFRRFPLTRRPLASGLQALGTPRWAPVGSLQLPSGKSLRGFSAVDMPLEAHALSSSAVSGTLQSRVLRNGVTLGARPPLPIVTSTATAQLQSRHRLLPGTYQHLSSASSHAGLRISHQSLFYQSSGSPWKVAGIRSHYSRIFGDDGDQLIETPEAADAAPLAHNGVSAPFHSYPNAMMPFLATPPPLDAVVKIFTVTSSPNYFLPWQNKPQREVSGSGFVISGERILTNAHVVANQTFVLVRKHGTSTKYRAEVEAVGHECDLAVLRVPNQDFWEGMHPLEFGEIPQLQEQVAVVGYPQGGDNISVTAGVVSRVELTQYAHGAGLLLAVQIDAAINPGNSGGPAVMDFGSGGMNSNWKVVGVAFQNLREADSIGYIIPVPVIQHFLEDVEENGHYVGFCSLGLSCQQLENAQLRDHLGMRPGMTGVLVNRVQSLTDSHNHIRKDDVLMAFDGVPIANDGTVSFRKRERISFDHLVAMKKAGETAEVKVLREGKELELQVVVNPVKALVPIHQYDKLPSYFIFAGLVFVPLTQPYLHEYGDDWYNTSPRRLCERAMRSLLTQEGEQMVILSQVLIDDINSGYQTLAELQVKKVNGVDIRNLRHLRRLVEGCTEKHVRFDLDDERVMVLNVEEAKQVSEGILSRHRIPSHISEDLMEDRFGDTGDGVDSTWPDQVTGNRAVPVEQRTNSKL